MTNTETIKKLFIDKNLKLEPSKVLVVAKFCAYCVNTIPILGDVKIQVVNDRDNYGIATTAAYKVGKNEVVVYGKDRALVDICRSIAHEMIHMMQDETGLLNIGPVRDVGGFHENQANAGAGALIKAFAQSQIDGKKIYEVIKKLSK